MSLFRQIRARAEDTMQPFDPDFEIIKMDAEIGSYQEDFEPVAADPAEPSAEVREARGTADG
jgi:hypothetical protein